MSDSLRASYEEVPYDARPIGHAEPDTIAACAILHGVTPPPPDRSRVLELGCAGGGNLISMAFALPKSQFVGVDLAPGQIATGQFAISEMGLQNIRLETKSIDKIDAGFGEFDYIICHGVYSWVPPHVQDAILRVCATNLAPGGIAYVSYNTYPGWHRRMMLRDMLMFHDDRSLPPDARIARAREFAEFLRTTDGAEDDVHATAVRAEVGHLKQQRDEHLFHEQLEPFNAPVYFSEFARRASEKGLRYVAEVKPTAHTPSATRLNEIVQRPDDVVRTEQYADFIIGRTFRRTLLCHESVAVAPSPLADAIATLMMRTRAEQVEPSAEDATRGPGVEAFRTPGGVTITTNHPLVINVLHVLSDVSPATISFDEVFRLVDERLGAASDETSRQFIGDRTSLLSVLLQAASNSLIEFKTLPSRFVIVAGKRPKASALARWQAIYSDRVTALGHFLVEISGIERFLLQHLDGTNDRSQLVRLMERGFASGDLKLGSGVPNREQLDGVVDDVLARLGRCSILTA